MALILVCVIGLSAATGAVAQILASRRIALPEPVAQKASDASADASAPRGSGASFTLGECLAIALVPSSVPCVALLLALGLAMAMGHLPKDLVQMYEQIAGGALLITYIKELFPMVLDQAKVAADALAVTAGGDATDGSRPSHGALVCIKIWTAVLMIGSIAASAIVQTALAGFPGVLTEEGEGANSLHALPQALHVGVFTPADTAAYYIGFFVDGVVLAYGDKPIRCDASLARTLLISLVFAIDNLLAGFGLVPVLKEAYGEEHWWLIMLAFAACILLGAVLTAALRYYAPSPVLHLVWFAFGTTSILVGALELMPYGLNIYVMLGIILVWMVLVVGDVVTEREE